MRGVVSNTVFSYSSLPQQQMALMLIRQISKTAIVRMCADWKDYASTSSTDSFLGVERTGWRWQGKKDVRKGIMGLKGGCFFLAHRRLLI